MNEEYVRRLEKALKEQKTSKRQEMMGALLKRTGSVFPKGIRSLDSGVKNIELYAPRGVNKNIIMPRMKVSAQLGAPSKLGAPSQIGVRGGLRSSPGIFKLKKLRLF